VPDRIARRLIIHGRVQGVFFRDSLRQRARDRDVAGWVTNREDGAVEALLEGPPEAIEEIITFARSGPPRASVERVEISEEPARDLTGFRVR
jgi:acylphosphatase